MLWLTILAAGLLTYSQRLSLIAFWGQFDLSPLMKRMLRFVPVSVLTALIIPELLLVESSLTLSLENPRLLAGLLATLVAWRTRNVLLTIITGMMALILLSFA